MEEGNRRSQDQHHTPFTRTYRGRRGIWMGNRLFLSCCKVSATRARMAPWDDKDKTMKLRRALVWHLAMPPTKVASVPPCHDRVGSNCRHHLGRHREGITYNQPCKTTDTACQGFSRGTCVDNTSHPKELHICSYCLHTVQHICYHTDQEEGDVASVSMSEYPQ